MSENSYIVVMRLLLLLAACVLPFGLNAQTTPDTICTLNCAHPGYRSITQEVGGETLMREYILHVPSGYDAASAHPLVLSLIHISEPTRPY